MIEKRDFYIDGAWAGASAAGFAAGEQITPGTLVFGQEQDLLGGGDAPRQGAAAEAPPVAVTRDNAQMMLGGMPETLAGACPDCGSQLEFAEGCMKCHVCGFSECG